MKEVIKDEFMLNVIREEAWKKLSKDVKWTDNLLEKYKDKIDCKDPVAFYERWKQYIPISKLQN